MEAQLCCMLARGGLTSQPDTTAFHATAPAHWDITRFFLLTLGAEPGFYVTNACKMSNIKIKCRELRTSGLAEGRISDGTSVHIEANRVSKKLARSLDQNHI